MLRYIWTLYPQFVWHTTYPSSIMCACWQDVVIEMPFTVYQTFIVEQKHGFNKQTVGFFIKDQLKKQAVSIVLTSLIFSLLIAVIQAAGENFFLYAWGLIFAVSVALFMVYHDFIAPLFDKFVSLPEGDLRTQIEALATELSFPLKKLEVVIGSKRSTHSNVSNI